MLTLPTVEMSTETVRAGALRDDNKHVCKERRETGKTITKVIHQQKVNLEDDGIKVIILTPEDDHLETEMRMSGNVRYYKLLLFPLTSFLTLERQQDIKEGISPVLEPLS